VFEMVQYRYFTIAVCVVLSVLVDLLHHHNLTGRLHLGRGRAKKELGSVFDHLGLRKTVENITSAEKN